jgi:hypothetical protein
MAYLLRMDGGRRTLMNGTGSLLLMGDGDAPPPSPVAIKATYREWIERPMRSTYREGP